MVGSLLNIPFSRELKRLQIEAGNTAIKLNTSILTDLWTIGISSLLLGAVLVFVGVWVTSKANLGAPLIARLFSRKPANKITSKEAILSSILLSVLVALVLLGLFELQ